MSCVFFIKNKNSKFIECYRVIRWIDNKMQVEKNLKDDELVKYQKIIDMTLDKCEEWTNYYK